jgi:hypothetical protein
MSQANSQPSFFYAAAFFLAVLVPESNVSAMIYLARRAAFL